ncbi:hypothetical protein Tsubulata_037155, partial [Turnera subulata]
IPNTGTQIEDLQKEIAGLKYQMQDMEKQLRVLKGNLSHITTMCEAEYQEQILEDALTRVRGYKHQAFRERYTRPAGASPASQVTLSPETAEMVALLAESPKNLPDWLQQRDPRDSILGFMDSRGLLRLRDHTQHVPEMVLTIPSPLIVDCQQMDLQDDTIVSNRDGLEDNNSVQHSPVGEVINVDSFMWSELYQTDSISRIVPTTQNNPDNEHLLNSTCPIPHHPPSPTTTQG